MSEATLKAYHAMNQFLSSFIERVSQRKLLNLSIINYYCVLSCFQSLQGLDYVIKDKLLPEKVLDMEFFTTPNMSTFYRGKRKIIVA